MALINLITLIVLMFFMVFISKAVTKIVWVMDQIKKM